MASFLCGVLGTSSGIVRGILGFAPGIFHILFRAILRFQTYPRGQSPEITPDRVVVGSFF
jgi:hypothetical protein